MTAARLVFRSILAIIGLAIAGCDEPIPPSPRDSWGPPEQVTAKSEIRFAAMGDYGRTGRAAHDVAALIIGWRPDVIITTGDNNYPRGEAATIDANVGRYYHRFLFPYFGGFGTGAYRNRFFPALGNHDLHAGGGRPFLDYFTLPGNERYYDFVVGPVRFFALNSDQREPDGTMPWSAQRRWLKQRLAESRARWNVVYFHHPPYSSGEKSNRGRWMRWPFAQWGADVVLAGHEHFYERLRVDGIAHFVVGLGGAPIYNLGVTPRPESRVRFNRDHGALLGVASGDELTLQFTTRAGAVIDRYVLRPRAQPSDAYRTRIGSRPGVRAAKPHG